LLSVLSLAFQLVEAIEDVDRLRTTFDHKPSISIGRPRIAADKGMFPEPELQI
jgi:hypothetical protein